MYEARGLIVEYSSVQCEMNTLPGFEHVAARGDDVIYTPPEVAREVVERFRPTGRVLDPAAGTGAFLDCMPGAEWCEIARGRDFFAWSEHVDWCVTNPPYSIFGEFMRHAMEIADNIVFLIPANKPFNGTRLLYDITAWGGIRTMYMFGPGSAFSWPIGFPIAAVHFERNYAGGMQVEWSMSSYAYAPKRE